MNWSPLIGTVEVIGVIAMIASFLYVVAQIRRNNFVPPAMIVTAVLLSPLLGVFLGTLFWGSYFAIVEPRDLNYLAYFPDLFLSAAGTAIVGLVFGIPIVALYGLPVAYLLRKLRLQYFWMYGLFGFIGGTAFILLPRAGGSAHSDSGILDQISFAAGSVFSASGLMTALVFWFIVEYIPLRRKRRQVSASEL